MNPQIEPAYKRRRWTRRKMLAGLAAAAGAVYVDMRYIEPNWIGVGCHRVPILPSGASPIRILQISDLHASEEITLDFIEHAVELGIQQAPDVVCLTGDFITDRWDEWSAYSKIMSRLSRIAPTYGSMGNHDGGEWLVKHGGLARPTKVIEMLENANVHTLFNDQTIVSLPNKPAFELVGLGDIWSEDFKPGELLDKRNHALPRVLMSHNPDTKDLIETADWDLMLSGHTHGGQLTLPWGSTPFAPVRDKRYVRGLHRWQEHWIHVTKGIASIRNMRLNCFPEISMIELVATG
jgi:predicted MPP superfamily phosphohydrolase